MFEKSVSKNELQDSIYEMLYLLSNNGCDLILLENPIKKLCSKECKGLCANCGTNFNKLDCECELSIENNRWIELKKLNN